MMKVVSLWVIGEEILAVALSPGLGQEALRYFNST